MRFGIVIGSPGTDRDAQAVALAQPAPVGAPASPVLRTPQLVVAVSGASSGLLRDDGTRMHDGWFPGQRSPADGHPVTLPDAGVTLVADPDGRGVTVGRDRVGVRPFHFAVTTGGAVVGASQLGPLAARADVSRIDVLPPGYVVALGPDGVSVRAGETSPEASAEGPAPDADAVLDELASDLRAALAASVTARSAGAAPAVLLSGGVDSSAVLALAFGADRRTRAVTVAAAGSPDLDFAQRLTGDLGITLHVIPAPDEAALLSRLDRLLDQLEAWESPVLTHAFPTDVALGSALTPGQVVLTGEGSDEMFGGYRRGDEPDEELAARRWQEFRDLHRTSCQRLDRIGAAAGVDMRMPFLDPAVVRVAFRIPPRLLVRGGLTKWPLRRAMRGVLPDYILDRPKLTFARGVGYQYGNHEDGAGLLAAWVEKSPAGAPRDPALDELARGPLERYALRRFLDQGYGKASYLLSRTHEP